MKQDGEDPCSECGDIGLRNKKIKKLTLCQLNLACHVRLCETSARPAKGDARGQRGLWREGGVCAWACAEVGTLVGAGVQMSVVRSTLMCVILCKSCTKSIPGPAIAIYLIGLNRRLSLWTFEAGIHGAFHVLRDRFSTHTPNLLKIS